MLIEPTITPNTLLQLIESFIFKLIVLKVTTQFLEEKNK